MRRQRRLVLPKKTGRADHSEAMPRADGDSDHVGGDGLAKAYTGIEAGRYCVDQRVIDNDLDIDVRILLQEARHDWQQHELRRLPRRVEAQRARRLAAEEIQILQRIVDVTEGRADPRE
jgi:hypothetical protein